MKQVWEFIKKRYLLCLIVVSFVLLVFIFPSIEKRGTFSLNDDQYVILECPETAMVGNGVTCNLILRETGKKVLSVNANYDLDEVLTYDSLTINSESGFELYSVDDDENESSSGFALINLEGVTSQTLLGTITFMVSAEASVNTSYNIGLVNIELVDDTILEDESYDMFDAADFTTSVRTLNNVAALTALSVENGVLDKEFSSDVFEYNITVPSSSSEVTINVTKSDANATLSGTGVVSPLELHYGTNEFTIIVTAEDGVDSKTYNVNIYREYTFTTEVYIYNETENYIYTRNDVDEIIISNLEMLTDDLHYAINNDKLEIVYGTEVLKSIKIINFNSNYTIVNKLIYIDNDVAYNVITGNITSDVLTFTFTDSEDNQITDSQGEFGNGAKMDVYYGSVKLDTYTFRLEYLDFGNLIYDNSLMLIKRLVAGTTYDVFLAEIQTNGRVEVETVDGSPILADSVIKTGDRIIIELTDITYEYVLSVLGDNNGDGIIEINDVGRLYKNYNNRLEFTDAQLAAGDVNGDGIIEINDVGRLYKFYNNKIPTLEVGGDSNA